MKKVFKSKIFLVWSGAMMFVSGLGTMVTVTQESKGSTIWFLVFIGLGILTCVNGLYHRLSGDVEIKE